MFAFALSLPQKQLYMCAEMNLLRTVDFTVCRWMTKCKSEPTYCTLFLNYQASARKNKTCVCETQMPPAATKSKYDKNL